MKTFLFSVILSGISVCVFAQSPTMDFENWTTMNNGTIAVPEEPTGWITGNQLVTFLWPNNKTSVFKVTGTEAHSGSAIKIVTTDIVTDPSGGQLPDPTGVAFIGKVQLSPLKLINGFKYSGRPAVCDFWYKYTPQPGDSASCGVVLTKWNGVSADTIASGEIIIKNAAASYTQASFNLTYNPSFPSFLPDTMMVGFSATCLATNTCGVVGSTLWVDDLSFPGWNGMNEHPSSNGIILYPNPANDFVSIYVEANDAVSAVVHDITGREVASSTVLEQMNLSDRKQGIINTSHLSAGIYSYTVVDKSGNILNAGKLSVIR